jgi:hypothetical protein
MFLEKGGMSLTLKLLDSNGKISSDINAALVKVVALQIQKNQKTAIRSINALVPKWIRQQPEINSLLSEGTFGSLNAQFGLLSGSSTVVTEGIISAIVDSIQVEVKPLTKISKSPVLVFSIQPTTFRELLELQVGKVTTAKGTILEWLEWLLLLGNRTVVYGYSYKPDRMGRSGGGVMEGGSIFRVPPQFAGSRDDNFITRALSNRDRELQRIFEGIFK